MPATAAPRCRRALCFLCSQIQHMADELLREPVFVMQDRECGFRYASANRNIEQVCRAPAGRGSVHVFQLQKHRLRLTIIAVYNAAAAQHWSSLCTG